MTDDMKHFLSLAAILVLAAGCGLRTDTYSDEQAHPSEKDRRTP